MTLIEQAREYAHKAHDSIGQERKYTGEPYWVHTDEVAALVASVTINPAMIIAAHLHDVLEDVYPHKREYSAYHIEKIFGVIAASYVEALTDQFTAERYPDLNRAERKAREKERISRISPEAKTIKLADLISNTSSIVECDEGFAKTYIKEKLNLLPVLEQGNKTLLRMASIQVGAAAQKLEIPWR